jgi:hypothetical protein
VIALVVFLSVLTGCASLRGTDDSWKVHEIVMEYPELSRADIQKGVETWIPELFRHAGLVIRRSDVATGRIVAAGIWKEATEYAPSQRADIHFTLDIAVMEEKARYRLDSLEARSDEGDIDMATVADSRQFHKDAEREFQSMIKTLSTALTSKVADW